MGQQAGGASVHYHMLSPLTRGLFHRAISMSGSALCWWASLKRPLEKAKKLARLTKCPHNKKDNMDDPDMKKSLVDCLKSKSMEELMNTHPNFYDWRHLEQCQEPMTAWSPRVDPESPIPFMPNEPIDVMKAGSYSHVPWITGKAYTRPPRIYLHLKPQHRTKTSQFEK
jgi:bile salt-stimulated lipase